MAQVGKLIERLPLTNKPTNLRIGRELNRGAYGVVYEGTLASQQIAVKVVHKLLMEAEGGENALRSFCQECERLKELEHPHVIKFLGAFKDAKLGPLLVMERMKENLRQFLDARTGKLTVQEQIRISLEITQGVAFLHQLSPPMVHRDLNDKNVMFTFDGVAKIGDFGQSKLKLQLHLTTAQPGMVTFMPPEALKIEQAEYDESLDMFSLGVLMLEIGTQLAPIVNMVGIGTIPETKRREKDLQKMSDLHLLKPFILLCLSDDQKKRPKATELEMVLPRLKENILQTMIAAEERFCRMEQEVQRKEELSAAKVKMDRMMNELQEEYHSHLKKKDEEIQILKRIIAEKSQSSSPKLSSKDTATGESEYVYVTNMRARSAPKVGTPRPPHYYNTPHTVAGQQRQQHRDELQSSPRLPRAVNREEHTYINVPAAAHTEAFPSKDDPVSSEGNEYGPSEQHSHKVVDRKAAMKLKLKPVKSVPVADVEELTPTADSPGAKSESDDAPTRVCGCGLRFAGDQGREFVKHTLTCSKGSPVCPPKSGRHSLYYTRK